MLPRAVTRPNRLILPLILVIGGVLRGAGLFDDFWLDEIWSWRITRSMHSIGDVLFSPAARIDNNHPLNTLLIYLLSDQRHWWIWRVPALIAGIGSIPLGFAIMRRRGVSEAWFAGVLFTLSYPLIFFSSEARGYALVVFFVLLAIDALDHAQHSLSLGWDLLFWFACAMGFLSHLTFVHAYVAMLVWSTARMIRRRQFARLARLHLIPLAFFAWLWWVFARHVIIGGSPPQRVSEAIVDAIGRLFASGESHTAALIATALAAGLFIWSMIALRRRPVAAISIALGIVVMPAMALTVQLIITHDRQPIAPPISSCRTRCCC